MHPTRSPVGPPPPNASSAGPVAAADVPNAQVTPAPPLASVPGRTPPSAVQAMTARPNAPTTWQMAARDDMVAAAQAAVAAQAAAAAAAAQRIQADTAVAAAVQRIQDQAAAAANQRERRIRHLERLIEQQAWAPLHAVRAHVTAPPRRAAGSPGFRDPGTAHRRRPRSKTSNTRPIKRSVRLSLQRPPRASATPAAGPDSRRR